MHVYYKYLGKYISNTNISYNINCNPKGKGKLSLNI